MDDSLAHLPPTRRADLQLSDASIRSAFRRGQLIALRRGVLVGRFAFDATQDDPATRHALLAMGAILSTRGAPAYACLGSAGLLHGFKRLGRSPERVRLYRRKGPPWRDSDVAVLTCGLPDAHVTEVMGVPSSTGSRTVVDLARWVSFRGGVVVADSALRLGVERHQLTSVARDCARWPGIRRARDVIEFADGRAASPLESVSRVVFHELGLPAPELQMTVARDEWGNPRIIVDFCWPELGVVGEADGLLKYDEQLDPRRTSLRDEKLRQEEIEALGYIVVRWTWDHIWRRPEWVVSRIRQAMAEATRRRRTA
jgi:very-short-patch-repair endonuclease